MPFDPLILEELVKESGISFKQNKKSFYFKCPRCNKRDRLFIRKKDGRFICWYCAAKDEYQGRCEYALSDLLSIPYKEIRLKLYGEDIPVATSYWSPIIRDFFGDEDELVDDVFEIEAVSWPLDFYPIDHQHSKKGADYLEGRGIPLATSISYGLRYNPARKRVYFPVTYNDQLVGWQGRLIVDNKAWNEKLEKTIEFPKILTSSGTPRDTCIMFSHRLTGSRHAIITEGPIDAIKCDLAGGNVATMGKVVTTRQIDVIKSLGINKIYIGLDLDAATETGLLIRSVDDLEFYDMRPKDSRDLGSRTPEEVYEMFLAAPKMNRGHFYGYIKDFNAI